MRVTLQPAFVLHYRPYRETSLIVELLTQHYGRIAVVARGVKTPRSPLRSLIQPFSPLMVSWLGKGELMTLTSAEAYGLPIRLKGDRLLSAFYLNELIIRVLGKHDAYPELYGIYQETLLQLQQITLEEKTLRLFEKKLLEQLGYGLQLQYDIGAGEPFRADETYRFYPEQGFKIIQQEDRTMEMFHFSGKSILAFAAEKLENNDILSDAKRLMRLALAPLLGSQPLQSRKLFIEIETE